jgi:murein DD-endopeptidase MepM/ murein hydrolase activator NlpD
MLRIALFLAALTAAFPAAAKRIYQWTDAQGVTHYTDAKPEGAETKQIKETLVRADETPIVDMSSVESGALRRVSFNNRLAGPVEVELEVVGGVAVVSEPPLPHRWVLAPNRESQVAAIGIAPGAEGGKYTVRYRAVPGDPRAQPDLAYRYRLPFRDGTRFELHQGFNDHASHNTPQSRYAVDLAVDEGTPVVAARAGVVMQVERDFYGAGADKEKFGGRANLVRVLHDDGTMAIYAHLALEGVTVSPGQRVAAGQQVGLSGNTGFSTGPHLHFSVQMNTGMDLQSIPFAIEGLAIPDG